MQIAYDYAFESMQANPEWAPSMTLVGLIELFSGKHDVACARIPKLLEVSKTSSEIGLSALVVHSCGDLESAITSYERVFSINPHHTAAFRCSYCIGACSCK